VSVHEERILSYHVYLKCRVLPNTSNLEEVDGGISSRYFNGDADVRVEHARAMVHASIPRWLFERKKANRKHEKEKYNLYGVCFGITDKLRGLFGIASKLRDFISTNVKFIDHNSTLKIHF